MIQRPFDGSMATAETQSVKRDAEGGGGSSSGVVIGDHGNDGDGSRPTGSPKQDGAMKKQHQGQQKPIDKDGKEPSIIRKIFNFILGQWLTIGFGLACLLAHFFPCELNQPQGEPPLSVPNLVARETM